VAARYSSRFCGVDAADEESGSGVGTRAVLADVLVKIMRCIANLALTPRLRAQVARHADINCIIDVLSGALILHATKQFVLLTTLQHRIAARVQLTKSWFSIQWQQHTIWCIVHNRTTVFGWRVCNCCLCLCIGSLIQVLQL
jgi:hypothetical protein